MIHTIPDLLGLEQLDMIEQALTGIPFVDGATTAGRTAGSVKNNLQADRSETDLSDIDKIILEAVAVHPMVRAAALPVKIRPPLYNRHDVGMSYGPHSDNPVIMDRPPVRTDMSMTIFLSAPNDYEGGELAIATDAGEAKVKLPRGSAVLYDTHVLHEVREVTRGTRLAAILWLQSMVADPLQRRMLFEIDLVCQHLNQRDPTAGEARLLTKNYNNLLRLWGQL